MKFKLIFTKEIIINAKSIDEAYSKVDNGEVVRAGFKTTTNGTQYDFKELPDFKIEPVSKRQKNGDVK